MLEVERSAPTLISSGERTLGVPLDRLRALFAFSPETLAAQPRDRSPFQGRLLGTLTSHERSHSVASLSLSSGRTVTVWEGDRVDDARIIEIAPRAVTVNRGGPDEVLRTEGRGTIVPPSVQRTSATEFIVSREHVSRRLQDLAGLSSEVHVVPTFAAGRPLGFRVFSGRPEGVLGSLGLQSGDVIRAVNGQPLDSLQRVLGLASLLERAGPIELELDRSGLLLHHRYLLR